MNKKLREKIMESVAAVLPITAIVLLLTVAAVPLEVGTVLLFLTGAVLLIVGMGFFQLGAEMSMTPLGEGIGTQLFKTRSLPLTVGLCFLMGAIITIAEPDLQVLANQVPSVPNEVLIWTVAVGVGLFLVAAALRILFRIPLPRLLCILYLALFALSFVTPADFVPVAFDSGGVTTGPMTVPFIMAMGIGLSAARSDKNGADDSFGLVAFSSIGPILMVLLLGIFYRPDGSSYATVDIAQVETTRDVAAAFAVQLPHFGREVLSSMAPVLAVFLLFQFFTRRYHRGQLLRMAVGFAYTIVGLILFLTGVNVGFAPVGSLLGSRMADQLWLLVPVGAVIGYCIVKAEPAVQILNHQVEDLTNGAISRRSMNLCLSLGVSAAVGLAMVRVVTGIHIYWILIPGYLIALILTYFVPRVFVGIAFDSGGVASGPMTSTFLLPLSIGACTGAGGSVVTDAFGVVALVALAPLIAVQAMGVVYARKLRFAPEEAPAAPEEEDYIIDLDEEVCA
ncbi:DUF1538 domain-containing protein [Oscillibacter hominis]|uniref:DUF1538 domain-containing protein n=1 Tax=Oscillibacter hominis TaxID=2763056 RepID=A0A7G9B3Z4_9FIRM|nr:DUF1538 domain-containing protein [Oscillibacter hominis]QNL44275.1 DUF1538 domain-containing protein [Oscillibacter hominis]